jgi:hypothetical protein
MPEEVQAYDVVYRQEKVEKAERLRSTYRYRHAIGTLDSAATTAEVI